MKTFTQQIDPHQLRQGLLNIKNTQIELLKQLKNEHTILQKYSPVYSIKEEDESRLSRADRQQQKSNQSSSIINEYAAVNIHKSQANIQKISSEIALLKRQNMLLNEDYQKIKRIYYIQKQKAREYQSHFNFSSRVHLFLFKQFCNGANMQIAKTKILQEIANYQMEFPQFKKANLLQALNLIGHGIKDGKEDESSISSILNNNGHTVNNNIQIGHQIQELKGQISQLMKINKEKQNKQIDQSIKQQFISQLKDKNQQLLKKNQQIDDLESKVNKLQIQNKEIQDILRKNKQEYSKQIQKYKLIEGKNHDKDLSKFKQLNEKIDTLQKMLFQKQKLQDLNRENAKKITELNKFLTSQNEKMKNQCNLYKADISKLMKESEQKQFKKEVQLKRLMEQNDKNTQIKESQILGLKNHIGELKRIIDEKHKADQAHRASSATMNDILMKRVAAMKANSTIDHLWKVKQVEFLNLCDLLKECKSVK